MRPIETLCRHGQDGSNRLFFALRGFLRWGRDGYQETAEPKTSLFDDREHPDVWEAHAVDLITRYGLERFAETSSRMRYLETLTYLEALEALLADNALPADTPLRWLDAGAKNWSYVEALYATLSKHAEDFQLDGVELDGYRLYADFHTRRSYAEAFIRPLPKASYHVADILSWKGEYDVISSFLPFVVEEPCLAWGLPRRHFQPEAYLHRLASLLAPGGLLLILNQGESEAEVQARLLAEVAPELEVQALGALPPSFLSYRYPRFGFVCRKPKDASL